jgi:hypothetical protein
MEVDGPEEEDRSTEFSTFFWGFAAAGIDDDTIAGNVTAVVDVWSLPLLITGKGGPAK